MTALNERLQQADMAGLTDAQAVAALNAPDTSLPAVPVAFSCRAIAEPAVRSGDLAVLRIVALRGEIPADLTPNSTAIPLPTQAIATIMTLLDAVDRDLRVDPAAAEGQVAAMLGGIEAMGLLSPATKADILSKTSRAPSWAEANGVTVDVFAVAAARAGATAVQVLGWQNNGPAAAGGVEEQANLRFTDGTQVGVIFRLPMANNAALRTAALNEWLSNNGDILS
jgi:hypothetical protein